MMSKQQKNEENAMQAKVVKPECLPNCTYLVNTLIKCKDCNYHPDNDIDKWDESRIDIIGQNGNEGAHYDSRWF